MGCTTSKLDDLPAVALCRERCSYLNDAIRQRYALAEAHVAYIHSLKEIGISLDRFFDTDLDGSASPVLPLPPHRKGDLDSVPVVAAVSAASATAAAALSSPPRHSSHSNSNSNSGSHLHFHSSDEEDDDEDDDDGSLHHSGNLSPFHHYDGGHEALGGGGGGGDIFGGGGFGDGGFGGGGFGGGGFSGREFGGRGGGGFGGGEFGGGGFGGGMHMNYMRKGPTQSVVHEQRPMSPETVQHMSGSSYFNYQNHENPNPYPYYNYPPSYSNYGFSGSSPPQYGSSYYPPQQHPANNSAAAAATSSKPPPPPPSPPRASPWDFLNPFDTIEKYYQANTPSRDSREVREEEGIPDLEDENYQDEVVKEVHGEQRFSDAGSRNHSKRPAVDEDHRRGEEEVIYEAGPSGSAESKGDEYEVHLVDKNVVANEERVEERSNVPSYKAQSGSAFRGASDVIKEIKSQFDRASESGIEVCRMLEVGKVPYPRKNAVYQVSSKMLHSITPSLSVVSSQTSTSKNAETSSSAGPGPVPVYLDVDGDIPTRSGKLSSTLQKLYIWEKKLYDEVKAEEKMRIVHERKCRRLKRLDERGAEAPKIDATRTLIRSLSTKIRIAIQVVDKISVKINTLRDEELWPQINELISGFIIMWKVMLECHQNQCHAITEAKNLDAITSNRRSSTDNLAAAMQLEDELLNWISNFSSWVGAQRGYVRALNGWLTKCLLQEPPEETVDGPVPYSPGRYGAPPIFVICNQWSQAVERLSDKEVIDAMRIFTVSVHHLLEQHDTDLRHRTLTNKDMESQVKAFARDEQKMQKKWQTVDKKMVLASGHGIGLPGQIIHQSDTSNLSSLQAGLKQIFEAMERFTANSMQAYEELRVRCEEQKASQENPRVS